MKEKFKEQLEKNRIVTDESLLMMKNKTYHNGEDVKIGDKILFGMTSYKDEDNFTSLTLIMLNENQIDLYESEYGYADLETSIPVIKLK